MLHSFKFLPNRVLRLYHGGSGIDSLCGHPHPEDTRFPENWIASCIEGNGRAYHSPGHGISQVTYQGQTTRFPDFLHQHAEDILGHRHLATYGETPAVLTKLLDSAEQLPMQVHPSRADAKTYFNADYGKTEAWIVLSTRRVNNQDPYLLVGFNDSLNQDLFIAESLAGTYQQGLDMLNKIPVRTGDVIIIKGGLPHAIGPGVTMVEVMEPSDLVIVPEINCCGVQLNPTQRFAGIKPQDAMKLFDFTPRTIPQVYDLCSPHPAVIQQHTNGTLTWLISYDDCPFFTVQRLTVNQHWNLLLDDDMLRVGVVTSGHLVVDGLDLSAGDNFMIPQCVKDCTVTGSGELLFILPPKP